MAIDPEIRDNREAHQYELTVGEHTAVVIYNEVGGGLLITETILPAGWPNTCWPTFARGAW